MKKLLFVLFFALPVFAANAQQDSSATEGVDVEFNAVQQEARFPGGLPAWRKYLEQNLNVDLADSCIVIPKGRKSARQTVVVSFKVDKTGKITDVKAENASEVHPRLAAEAVRVIKNGPDWLPAEQDGKKVIYRQRQSITWVVSN